MALPSAGPTDCSSGLSQRIFQNLSYDSKWVANQAGYAVGSRACPTTPNGFGYQVSAITTGTTSGSEPTWPVIINNTVVDGGVTWKCIETANPTGRVLSVNPGYVLTTADLDGFRLLAYDIARGVADEIGGGSDYASLIATTAAGQSIPSGVVTIVVFGTVERDTDSAYNSSTGRYTIPTGKGGDYVVSAAIRWNTNPGVNPYIIIYKNAVGVRDKLLEATTPGGAVGHTISATLNLAPGDIIDIRLSQASGGAVALSAVAAGNYFSIARLLGS